MFDIYARSFLEATRFTPNTRPGSKAQERPEVTAQKRQRHLLLWQRRPYWA
ncbi:hypothetical protein [Roseibium sp. Sym1]|uniref:hypothetical protein n=1 Tax=Roseibium sp. Sym1 TaxID=3016006 RepID=UPI0022B4C9ED|nr:hypothetical protein [Roseibium sp. Sym1]